MFKEVVADGTRLLRRRQIRPSHACALATARLLLRVVTTSRTADATKLIERVQHVGRQLIAAHPREMVVGNIVRRVLGLIRDELESDRLGDSSFASDAGSDSRPRTPATTEGKVKMVACFRRSLRYFSRILTISITDTHLNISSSLPLEPIDRLSSRPPAIVPHPPSAAVPGAPAVSMLNLLSHPSSDSPQSSTPGNVSPSGVLEARSESKNLRAEVLEGINEILDELGQADDQIAAYALDHIHSNEVILTHSSSTSVQKFLLKAATKRKFTVIHAESYPNNHRDTHAYVAGPVKGDDEEGNAETFQKTLRDYGITVILIPDSAVFAMMSRVNKVILGPHSVLANGGLVAAAGTRVIANAAKVHQAPVVVVSGIYKLSPIYPFDYASLIEHGDTSAVLGYEDGALVDKIDVDNPLYDYVPAELVDLYVTNL